jgi:hypothetical protein
VSSGTAAGTGISRISQDMLTADLPFWDAKEVYWQAPVPRSGMPDLAFAAKLEGAQGSDTQNRVTNRQQLTDVQNETGHVNRHNWNVGKFDTSGHGGLADMQPALDELTDRLTDSSGMVGATMLAVSAARFLDMTIDSGRWSELTGHGLLTEQNRFAERTFDQLTTESGVWSRSTIVGL